MRKLLWKHPASYRGCVVAKEIQKRMIKTKFTKNRKAPKTFLATKVVNNISYAQMAQKQENIQINNLKQINEERSKQVNYDAIVQMIYSLANKIDEISKRQRGDYNAKHMHSGSRLTSTRRELRQAIKELGCHYLSTGKLTYWPTYTKNIPDLLNFYFAKRVSSHFVSLEDNYDLNSFWSHF